MSNTAERPWVRTAARWLARFDTVKGQLQAVSLAVTAFSTFSLVLQNAGLGAAIPFVGVGGVVGGVAYTYYFSEGGVYNQKQRDKRDLGDNFSAPTMLLEKRIQAKQLALAVHALQNGREVSYDELAADLEQLTDSEWAALRDGVDLDTIDTDP